MQDLEKHYSALPNMITGSGKDHQWMLQKLGSGKMLTTARS